MCAQLGRRPVSTECVLLRAREFHDLVGDQMSKRIHRRTGVRRPLHVSSRIAGGTQRSPVLFTRLDHRPDLGASVTAVVPAAVSSIASCAASSASRGDLVVSPIETCSQDASDGGLGRREPRRAPLPSRCGGKPFALTGQPCLQAAALAATSTASPSRHVAITAAHSEAARSMFF